MQVRKNLEILSSKKSQSLKKRNELRLLNLVFVQMNISHFIVNLQDAPKVLGLFSNLKLNINKITFSLSNQSSISCNHFS